MHETVRAPFAVLVHLTGSHRGQRQALTGGAMLIGTSEDAEVRFPGATTGVSDRHATLIRESDRWVLWAEPQEAVFVDGERIEEHRLRPGDVLRVGHGGPLLRFRIQDTPPGEYKTMAQALQDCADCAMHGSDRTPRRIGLFVRCVPRELFTQTAPAVRLLAGGVLTVLLAIVLGLGIYTVFLERRLDEEARRLATIEAAVRDAQVTGGEREMREMLGALETGLTQRIEALESRSEAGRRVVAEASGSVMLLQGAYGFRDTVTGGLLRLVLDADGRPLRAPGGGPMVSSEGEGPPLEKYFTGSAFIVLGGLPEDSRLHADLLVTNRHVVRPWEFDPLARAFVEQGFLPELRVIGYLPGHPDPIQMEIVASTGGADLALLYAPGVAGRALPLPLGEFSPEPGDEVIVLGYPTGFAALLARSDAAFLDSLTASAPPDFWEVARRLAAAGLIRPLATQGIVGQVTSASVVYDAETTRGGSGGPVLDLEGRVVAVTVGVMEDFGGSNLGVPVEAVQRMLLELVRGQAPAEPRLPEPRQPSSRRG